MRRKVACLFVFLISQFLWSQSVIINHPDDPESQFQLQELIDSVFIKGNTCAPPISNFQYFDNPNKPFPSKDRSWGYFRNDPSVSNFSGVLITNGRVKNAEGPTKPYPDNSYGNNSWAGDADAAGILGGTNYNSTSFEFDFVPTGTSIYFRFSFATSEYPQSMKNDLFAVLLSGPGIQNDPGLDGLNIAKQNDQHLTVNQIAGTNMFLPGPFDEIGYSADSKEFSVNYYFLVPYQTYHVKFVIVDAGDVNRDTGIFLKEESFIYDYELVNTGQDIVGSSIRVCHNENYTLMVNTDDNDPNITYQWYYKSQSNDDFQPIAGATSRVFIINRGQLVNGYYSGDGFYGVKVNNVQLCDRERFLNTKIMFGDTPVINSSIPVFSVCSDSGSSAFDLNSLSSNFSDNPDVLYTFQHNVNGQMIPIDDPSSFVVTGTAYVQVRAAFINNICPSNFEIELHVGAPQVALPYPEAVQCSANGQALFNLHDYENEFTVNGVNYDGVVAEFYTDPQHINLINNPEQYENISNPQTIYVKLFYPEIPECYATSELTLKISSLPATQDGIIDACDLQNNGNEIVDLTQNNIVITPGIAVQTTYFDDQGNAINNPQNYLVTQEVSNFSVLIENAEGVCSVSRPLTVKLFQVPVTHKGELITCGFGGTAELNLQDLNGLVINNPEDFTFSYYLTLNNAQNAINPLPENFIVPQPDFQIFVRVETNSTCFDINKIDIQVEDNMKVLNNVYYECDSPWESSDGFTYFDLTIKDTEINAILNLTETNITFHTSLADANAGINAIPNPENYMNITNPQTIYARAENLHDNCGGVAEFQIETLPVPDLDIDKNLIICADNNEIYSIDGNFESYTWYDSNDNIISSENGVIFAIGGTYTIEVTQAGMSCPAKRSIEVLDGTPVILGIDIDDNDVIFSATGGVPPYQYSYNNGLTWISWNSVKDLPPGIYELIVKGATGCISDPEPFVVLYIPNVITPNGDGKNDTWHIRGISILSNANIKIFDRYGKVFFDRKVTSDYVWNGEYMGRNVPTGDYWYIITIEGRNRIVGHLSVLNQ